MNWVHDDDPDSQGDERCHGRGTGSMLYSVLLFQVLSSEEILLEQ
jgi:hypothetical protein